MILLAEMKLVMVAVLTLTLNKMMSKLRSNGVLFWRRLVDDTFVLVKETADVDKLLDILNSFDNNIVFTSEVEKFNSLPFLDIQITR